MPKSSRPRSKNARRQRVSSARNDSGPGSFAVRDVAPMRVPVRDPVSTFRRSYSTQTLSAANTGDTVNAFSFTLASVPNYTEFTSLFDEYRIMEVTVSFMPYFTVVSSASGGVVPGIIGTVIDFDDAALPGSLTDLQQYDSYQRVVAVRPFRRVIHPRSAIAAYSGTFTSYGNVYGMWHDAASPNVQHYGIKIVIHGCTFAASTNIYEVETQVVIQCRSQH